ncbi:sulfopyruvate decarboxylase subunit beta [Methanobrevibacter sp. TMH8]|uniref:sulfopyruvate decarboxylase subunit beta n=1 Tax=Methanobrevibacter sp. TMH8 TaxID=2848611 RepID=UPI001CCFD793|nr:sulfopyruvate decarboxylase subunit beta [Methanobrevibacter sp. TMH8]MBZ9571420.1 sulfopyruvate decarboxylase subunit beta [Methanobrevibacter sp. TMH8]
MERFDGIKDIMEYVNNEIVVCNIGFPSRELYQIKDRAKNFYMLGSMGLASSIGLGLAISKDNEENKNEKVIVFDGDGSVLMNMGSLVTIFNQNPKNLILIVFDNGCYGSTGNQCTYAQNIDLLEVAKGIGFENCYNYKDIDFRDILKNDQKNSIFIHYKINPGNADSPIIDMSPEEIRDRFLESIK